MLQSMGSQRVGHNLATTQQDMTPWSSLNICCLLNILAGNFHSLHPSCNTQTHTHPLPQALLYLHNDITIYSLAQIPNPGLHCFSSLTLWTNDYEVRYVKPKNQGCEHNHEQRLVWPPKAAAGNLLWPGLQSELSPPQPRPGAPRTPTPLLRLCLGLECPMKF